MKFNLIFFCFCCCCFSVYVMLIVKFINVGHCCGHSTDEWHLVCESGQINKNGHYCQAATALIVDTKIKSNQSTQPCQSSIQLVCSASSLYIIGTF